MRRAFTPIDIAGRRAHSRRTMPEGRERFLTVGYVTAIALSLLGLVLSALYLFVFLWLTPRGPLGDQYQLLGQTAQLRLLLLSTAIFVGMSFGFLGFGLFLIQAKGDVDAEVTVSDYKLKFARLSPGLFVILCATAIIIVCATFRIEFKGGAPPATEAAAGGTAPQFGASDVVGPKPPEKGAKP